MMTALEPTAHVVVTGAAGAIGSALAFALRVRLPRARLALVDRDAAGLARLACEIGGEVTTVCADLALQTNLPPLADELRRSYGSIAGLVNCAGFMHVAGLAATPWDTAAALLQVDLCAPLWLMHACTPDMVAARRGFVVNVASMAGRVPLKGCAFYGAAKAGLAMASEIAHAELAPHGVHVLTVYPGPVASTLERAARAQYRGGFLANHVPTGDPTGLARDVMAALEARRRRVIYPSTYRLGYHVLGMATRFALRFGPDPRSN